MSQDQAAKNQRHQGFDELNVFWSKLDALETALTGFSEDALSFVEDPIERTLEKIQSFEPSVSIIGQVKAGKSTLMNALIGETSLLPSDVNPWTSVITGIHLNSRRRPPNTRALFRFFDAHEWDRLVTTGGRLGEMANRAGFEAEADDVKSQVQKMRQTTEERLGDEFEKLLGSSHAFETIEKDTIDRYICYGDPDDAEGGIDEGVYADLTKSADLYIDLPNYPKGLCLRDTPGVNDTFMMREQITLNAISESRVCVVVLSAHQALSTMDMALLRIICSVQAREVLIFVNRMDELVAPQEEAPKIRASIEKTLERLGAGQGIEILFGSGYWANHSIDDICDKMNPASRASLEAFFADSGADLSDPAVLREKAMEASGVESLHRAIAKRIVEGPGKAILKDVNNELDNIVQMTETVISMADRKVPVAQKADVNRFEITDSLAELRLNILETFDKDAASVREGLRERLVRAQQAFVVSALEALQSHVNTHGEFDSWNHEPTSLRMMMRTAFTSSCTKLRRKGEERLEDVLDGVQDILQGDLGIYQDDSGVELPEQPEVKSPTNLAKTLSLDLQGPWWRKFWRFGGKKSASKRYKALIESETDPLIDELLTDFFDPAVESTRDVIVDFAIDQNKFVTAILECIDDGASVSRDAKTDLGRIVA
ncbi:dynamin family protein [Actibacterium lipolyticum]|uniref:GTP-binding protein Der n=1 Tax=Actibacterium lipolyticum TaxID=1524263 RepID=A0A238L842_9RHOB|nr:dynamin family protein [Actibacterium lipolyticum]SMX51283.1 GTP-binding protein Der [Actibacterium lipolyticum]